MSTLIHAVVGYFFLLLVIRTLARRPGAQMTPFEFVLIFLIGGVIILATAGEDRSITNCYGAVIIICLIHRSMNRLKMRSKRLGTIIDGTPSVLLKDGQWQMKSMRQNRVADMDVMASARAKSVKTLNGIKYAVLERNGSISIIKKD